MMRKREYLSEAKKTWISSMRKEWNAWVKKANTIGKGYGTPGKEAAVEYLNDGIHLLEKFQRYSIHNQGLWPYGMQDKGKIKKASNFTDRLEKAFQDFREAKNLLYQTRGAVEQWWDTIHNLGRNSPGGGDSSWTTSYEFKSSSEKRFGPNGNLDALDALIVSIPTLEIPPVDKVVQSIIRTLKLADDEMTDLNVKDQTETEFTLGKFKIIVEPVSFGRYTARKFMKPEENVSPLRLKVYRKGIEMGQAALKRAGFGKALYGIIRIRSDIRASTHQKKSGATFKSAASYHVSNDVIDMHSYTKPEVLAGYLIHEIGHRWYYRFLTSAERARFDHWFETIKPTTNYGSENPAEDFAEVFRYYVTKQKLTPEQRWRFKTIAVDRKKVSWKEEKEMQETSSRLRGRSYLSEAVQPGAVIDNGAIRIYVQRNIVMIEDLRHAGDRTKKANRFVIVRNTIKTDANKPIDRFINWVKRARTYAMALSVAKEAIEEAEGLAISAGVTAPYLDQYEQKANLVAPSGTPDNENQMLKAVGNNRRKDSFFGRLVSTTKKHKEQHVSQTPEAEKTRPKQGGDPLRKRGYRPVGKETTPPDGAQAPKKDNVVQAGIKFEIHSVAAKSGPGGSKVMDVVAMNAAQALKIAGYSLSPMNASFRSRLAKEGISEREYGVTIGFDLGKGIVAISRNRGDLTATQKSGGMATVTRIGPKKTMKKATFKMGDEVTDGFRKFIYLFRSKGLNGDPVYFFADMEAKKPLSDSIFVFPEIDPSLNDFKVKGAPDRDARISAIENAYTYIMGSTMGGDVKKKMAGLHRKFVGTRNNTGVKKALPTESGLEPDPEFAMYDVSNAGKIIGRERTGDPVTWMKHSGYTPERPSAEITNYLKSIGLGFMTYGNHIVISYEDGIVVMLPGWSPVWNAKEKKAIISSTGELFKHVNRAKNGPDASTVPSVPDSVRKGKEQRTKKRKEPTEDARDKMFVPKEILRQLGGNKFQVMTGAKNFAGDENRLVFSIPKAKNGINFVQITLMPTDTYKVEFGKKSRSARIGYKKIKIYDDVYSDMLRELFEKETGLYTSL
jgi:hypothetical protein